MRLTAGFQFILGLTDLLRVWSKFGFDVFPWHHDVLSFLFGTFHNFVVGNNRAVGPILATLQPLLEETCQ